MSVWRLHRNSTWLPWKCNTNGLTLSHKIIAGLNGLVKIYLGWDFRPYLRYCWTFLKLQIEWASCLPLISYSSFACILHSGEFPNCMCVMWMRCRRRAPSSASPFHHDTGRSIGSKEGVGSMYNSQSRGPSLDFPTWLLRTPEAYFRLMFPSQLGEQWRKKSARFPDHRQHLWFRSRSINWWTLDISLLLPGFQIGTMCFCEEISIYNGMGNDPFVDFLAGF